MNMMGFSKIALSLGLGSLANLRSSLDVPCQDEWSKVPRKEIVLCLISLVMLKILQKVQYRFIEGFRSLHIRHMSYTWQHQLGEVRDRMCDVV